MINAFDIRASIGEFLAGDRGLDGFEDWLVSHTWNIHKWGDVESQMLAYGIELRLAEYNAEALSLSDLRSELQNIANTFLLNLINPRVYFLHLRLLSALCCGRSSLLVGHP